LDGEGTPHRQVSSLSTLLRIQNEVVIGPRDNGFPGPAVAIDGPAYHGIIALRYGSHGKIMTKSQHYTLTCCHRRTGCPDSVSLIASEVSGVKYVGGAAVVYQTVVGKRERTTRYYFTISLVSAQLTNIQTDNDTSR